MNNRRLVGIDLGIASAHTVRVLDGEGTTIAKRKAWPNTESLTKVETAALAGTPAGTRLEVVIEPTGPAWLPIAVFFSARGHAVFRVSSAKAADLRRFLSRHTKTNGIDADTLARLPLFDPTGLVALELPGAERAALDRRVRACDRLTRAAAEHKVRIKDLVRQLLPMTPLIGDLGMADLAVLERWADPNALVKVGARRLRTVIAKASKGHLGAERAEQWLEAARSAVELYGDMPAWPWPIWPPRWPPRCACCRPPRPNSPPTPPSERALIDGWTPSPWPAPCPAWPRSAVLPWWRPWDRPVASAGASSSAPSPAWPPGPRRPARATARASPCPRLARRCCAPHWCARLTTPAKSTPQLARIYYVQMVERGKDHLGALCVVAATLAERAWAVMDRGMPYVICDTDGEPVTAEQAKAIITERFCVGVEVRARRRTKKMGKAPQKVLTGQSKPGARGAGGRGDLPRSLSSTDEPDPVNEGNGSTKKRIA